MIEMQSTNGYTFYISECDYEKVSKYKWYAKKQHNTYYLHNTKGDEFLHRYLLNPPPRVPVDHIDNNGLNNTRENLRIVNESINAINTKRVRGKILKHKGVSYDKREKGWQARLSFQGKRYEFRYFDTKEEACIFYNRKALEIQGEYACLIDDIEDDGREILTRKQKKKLRKGELN